MKVDKRGFGVLIFLFFAIVFLLNVSFVSAAGIVPIRDVMNEVTQAFVDIFEPILIGLFGDQGWVGNLLFERFLIMIVFVILISLVLERTPLFEDQKGVRIIISVIIPLIGMRFMDYSWLMSIIDQYVVLVIFVSAIIPFVLTFYFIYAVGYEEYGVLRKISWIVFIGVYAGLWSNSLSDNSIIYFWTMLAAIICLIFDGIIYRRFRTRELLNQDSKFKAQEMARIRKEIKETDDAIQQGRMNRRDGEKIVKDLYKHLKWLAKQ
jgi:hypothetical protein